MICCGDCALREWLKRLAPALENATKIQETKRPQEALGY